jgi:hypothetical protein
LKPARHEKQEERSTENAEEGNRRTGMVWGVNEKFKWVLQRLSSILLKAVELEENLFTLSQLQRLPTAHLCYPLAKPNSSLD